MKKILILVLYLIAPLTFSQIVGAGEVTFSKYGTNDFQSLTLYTAVDQAAGDTSDVLYIPFEVGQAIFYLEVDTISTSDSLKTMVIQGSPDKTKWHSVSTSLTNVGASGALQRLAVTLVDKYIRFIFAVSGSDVKLDFKLKVLPKP